MSYQKVVLVGNLGQDPEVRNANDKSVCNFSIATNKVWKGKDGQKQEKVTWHRIVVWGPQAESCGKFLSKGRQVLVEGEIDNRSYEHDGVTKYISEIIAREVKFLGGKEGSSKGDSGGGDYPPPSNDFGSSRGSDDDIPF